MASSEIHVEDIGTAVRLTLLDEKSLPLDVSAAVALDFTFLTASRRKFTVPAALVTDGKDGAVEYVVQDGDLDVAGPWKLQARVTFVNARWSSNIVSFQVSGNL
jgi:hypothetical protein